MMKKRAVLQWKRYVKEIAYNQSSLYKFIAPPSLNMGLPIEALERTSVVPEEKE